MPIKVWSRPVTRPVAGPASSAMKSAAQTFMPESRHMTQTAAGAEGAVHGQVCHVKDAVGQIHANGHDAPDEALRTGTGQRTGQIGKSCKQFQNKTS